MKATYRTLLTEAGEQGKYKDGWKWYPRPQMKRDGYLILSEGWTLDGAEDAYFN